MDFATGSRPRGAKYGKNKSRTQLHHFYDHQASVPMTMPLSKRLPISPSSAGTPPQQDRIVTEMPVEPPSPSPVRSLRPAHVTSHSRSPIPTKCGSRSTSPTRRVSDAGTSTYDMLISTYDMISSSDENDLETLEQRPIKRPKLSPPERQKKPAIAKTVASHQKMDENTERDFLRKKEKNVDLTRVQEKERNNSPPAKIKPQGMNHKAPRARLDLPAAQPAQKLEPRKLIHEKKITELGMVNPLVDSEPAILKPAVRKSRTKLKPRALALTPRKPQQPLDGSDTSGASPSQLGIDHLRLSNETSPDPESISTTSHAVTSVSELPRGRKRLIDRLDAAATEPTARAKVAANNFDKEIEKLQRQSEPERPPAVSDVPQLSRSGSSQTRQTYGRSRNTYTKERSHLSDMIDDLDNTSTTSSQGGSQQLLSGLLSNGPSQLQSQLEIESDSSEDAPTFRLKSIYELKQAGSNNRLEKEVEDLMVDINPTGGSKALRIQALMQIMRKTSQEGFASFLFEHALDRLSAWSLSIRDKISKLLLGMIFWRLVHCNVTSPPSLKQIIQCVVSNSSSLPPLESIHQIAKNRAENLSKSTIRDLVAFEQLVLSEKMLPAYEGEGIIPAAITLGILEHSLRKIIDAGTVIPLPQSSYTQIIALLQQVSQPSATQVVKHVFVTKLALSLLKICAGPLEQDLGLSQTNYQVLGDTLGDVIHRSLNSHEDLIQSVLHFAITLCNDRPNICEAMCASILPSSLMKIVQSRFTSLVNAAQDSREVESAMLDSIILSLACLLNLTEHSDKMRRNFATAEVEDHRASHYVSLLVDTYIETKPRMQVAETVEQMTAFVMVGYLSLLVCNLCLENELWQIVSDRLTTTSQYRISDIVVSAKELLIHLKTVDDADMGMAPEKSNTNADNFTMRYGDILNSVRLE